jgi:type VI protein secretion system component Hcp
MATDIFAKIGSIKGESADDKHKDEIEVLSFSWGVANSGLEIGSGGVRARRLSRVSPSFTTSTRRRRIFSKPAPPAHT